MNEPTNSDIKAAFAILLAASETIRELKRVPSGHLYAQLCGKLDIRQYEGLVRTLVNSGMVEKSGDELIWVGPEVL